MGMGTDSKVALKKGTTWGTDATPGSGSQVPYVTCGVQPVPARIEDDDINPSGVRNPAHLGNSHVEGPLVFDGAYEQAPHLLLAALFMGQAGVPTTVEAGVYLHSLPWLDDIEGLFASLWVDYSSDAYGYASIKPVSRQISIDAAGKLRETYQILGRGVDKTVSFASVTYADDPIAGGTKRILQRHMTVRANAQGGGALGSGDVLKATAMSINMQRDLTKDFTSAGALEEPVRSGFGSITGELTFHRMTAAQLTLFADAHDAQTALKLDAILTHDTLLGSTEFRKREFHFPYIQVTAEPREISGPGPNAYSVSFEAFAASAAPTGFPSGATQPCVERWQSEQSADPLA